MIFVSALVFGGCGDDDSGPGTLFVQHADSATIGSGDQGLVLTLNGVDGITTTFSDRPARTSGTMETATLAEDFGAYFGDDSPNAALSSLDRGKGEFTVELSDPRYDPGAGTLTYRVKPVGPEGADLPESLGPVSLFIDGGLGSYITTLAVTYKFATNQWCAGTGVDMRFNAPQPIQSLLLNPDVTFSVPDPDFWPSEPPAMIASSTGRAFTAGADNGDTRFQVQYDIDCNGDTLGTVTVKGSVPDSQFKPDKFSCSVAPAPGKDPPECRASGISGWHTSVTATLE